MGHEHLKPLLAPDYEGARQRSERVAWQLDDVLAEDAALDFSRPFLPDGLVAEKATGLAPDEALAHNHVRARGYLGTFALVEELIVPFVLEHLRERAGAAPDEIAALAGFAGEELKHIALFRRFERVFDRGFAHGPCALIGPADAVSRHVLAQPSLGVGLFILHIEWMTQHHYVAMARDDDRLEPCFRRLLHEHWLEESQHARIDEWIVHDGALAASAAERAEAFDSYLALLQWLEAAFDQQAAFDLETLERAGLALDDAPREPLLAEQRQSLRRTFLGAGIGHPRVQRLAAWMYPPGRDALAEHAARWS